MRIQTGANAYMLTRAYGPQTNQAPQANQAIKPAAQGQHADATRPNAVPQRAPLRQAHRAYGVQTPGTATIRGLVAGVAPGGITFDGDAPMPTAPARTAAGAVPFYRHPADRNTAATGVTAGALIDTVG